MNDWGDVIRSCSLIDERTTAFLKNTECLYSSLLWKWWEREAAWWMGAAIIKNDLNGKKDSVRGGAVTDGNEGGGGQVSWGGWLCSSGVCVSRVKSLSCSRAGGWQSCFSGSVCVLVRSICSISMISLQKNVQITSYFCSVLCNHL